MFKASAAELVIAWNQGEAKSEITLESGLRIQLRHLWTPLGVATTHSRLTINDRNELSVMAELRKRSEIRYIETDSPVVMQALPDDLRLGEAWHLDTIQAPLAWDISRDCRQALIAVVDTGIDLTHPDLSPNLWVNPNEIADNGIDDDANGVIDDIHGFNAIESVASGLPSEIYAPGKLNFHGTHVAGIIAAVGNNGEGSSGLCWNARLMDARFLNSSGAGSVSDAVSAIQYALSMRAEDELLIINNSWTIGNYSRTLEETIEKSQNNGVLFVVAAGNSGRNNDIISVYPGIYSAAYSHVVSVGNSTEDDQRFLGSGASNYGVRSVDLFAPGTNIFSTLPDNGYASETGTSMAAPLVSATAALLDSIRPNLHGDELRGHILNSAVRFDPLKGYSVKAARLDTYATLEQAYTDAPSLFYLQSPRYDSIYPGAELTISGTYLSPVSELQFNQISLAINNTGEGEIGITLPDSAKSGYLQLNMQDQLWLDVQATSPDQVQIQSTAGGRVLSWSCSGNCEEVTIQRSTSSSAYETVATIDSTIISQWIDNEALSDEIICYRLQSNYQYLSPSAKSLLLKSSLWTTPVSSGTSEIPRKWLSRYLGSGKVGEAYYMNLLANNAGGYVALDSLPPGIELTEGGVLSGSPTTEGEYSFRLIVLDNSSCPDERLFKIVINSEDSDSYQVLNYSERGYLIDIQGGKLRSLQWRVPASWEIPPDARDYDLLEVEVNNLSDSVMINIKPTAGYRTKSLQVDSSTDGWRQPSSQDGLELSSGRINWVVQDGTKWDLARDDSGVLHLRMAVTVNGEATKSSNGIDLRCFIATALYNNNRHPDLDQLRRFRDWVIATLPVGPSLVSYYYQHGAIWAQYVKDYEWLRQMLFVVLQALMLMYNYIEQLLLFLVLIWILKYIQKRMVI